MIKKALLGICLALPVAAMAQEFSYDYIEAGYSWDDGDGFEADSIGANIGWAPTANTYTRFGAGYTEIDDSPIDGGGLSAAVGGRWALNDYVDFYGGLLAAWERVSDTPFDNDIDGYGLGAELGLRARLFPQFEVGARGTYLDLSGGDLEDYVSDTDDFTVDVNALLHVTPTFAIGAGYAYAIDAETDTVTVGVRYNF